ncbi:MAG: KamA family radical SAM protein [Deltaproteobacteria bacterium]|nr:KamA family radical SAM protein [Deltaproteobacteria bacterium]
MSHATSYRQGLQRDAARILKVIADSPDLATTRTRLASYATEQQAAATVSADDVPFERQAISRDCARVFQQIVNERSDRLAGFSVVQVLHDLAHGVPRPDMEAGFYAEMRHILRGLEGRSGVFPDARPLDRLRNATGRVAARARSDALDRIAHSADHGMDRYPDGLQPEMVRARRARRAHILEVLGGTRTDWNNWRWQVRHVVRDPDLLCKLVRLSPDEETAVRQARAVGWPFGITPYYLSLMSATPGTLDDLAVRAQVLPRIEDIPAMLERSDDRRETLDFMREGDTSPVDLVTRRYPGIVILKPFNTCPQICVYCQRNWEIEDAMAPGAFASWEAIDHAIDWIGAHQAIHEVLVTGGDVLALSDRALARILEGLARIDHVDVIRIGTRVPVTVPMRVTPALATMLGRLRKPGRREVCIVTHVEHASEITPDFVRSIERLRRQGLSVFNQFVFQFFVSRRFEPAKLRMILRRCGVEPYYSFVPKGKDETRAYRVPIARLLQEQKEEVRLLPGLRRTDEVVFNVPGLGKNNLRAFQHRDLISIRPDGSRVYEFHPWEKMVAPADTWVGDDVPIFEYLERLATIGENPRDYASIWYYY